MKKFFLFFLFSTILFANTYEPNAVDRRIINSTFNEDFNEAKKIAQDQINTNPNSPKYYYYMINVKILEYYQRITDMPADKRDEGRKALNKELINYCENIIDKFGDSKFDTENKFYYGSIYGYLARVYGLDRSWWGAFKSGMKAEDIMEEVLKADPKFYDAYLLLGMLNYYADRLSGITSFVAGILGYSGNREKGLYQLQLAFDKGTLTFGQTTLTLIEVYSNLEDNDSMALKYYEKFLEKFPESKRVLNGYFQKLVGAGKFVQAETVMKNDKLKLLDDYTIAAFYSAKGNSELALNYAENAIANKNRLWRGWLDNMYFTAALNSWLLGDKNKSAKYEKELNERYKENFDAIKKNEKIYKWLHSLSTRAANGIVLNDFENEIKTKPNLKGTEDFSSEFYLIAGKFYYQNNMIEKAEQNFLRCAAYDDEGNKYNALKYLVDIYMRGGVDKNKVKKLLDVIDDFDNDRLSFRAKDLEKKYNL